MPSEVSSDQIDLGVWGMTDTGQLRSENQDAFFALELASPPSEKSVRMGPDSDIRDGEVHRHVPLGPRGALLLVADGMGGAAGGEVASQLAVTAVREAVERIWRSDSKATVPEFAERIRDAVVEAHARVHAYAAERPWLRGMGTTMTAAGVLDNAVVFAQVGDSRAYVLREQQLVQTTKDQTWVQEMIDAGTMTQNQARTSPRRSLLLQALGTTPNLLAPVSFCEFKPGDILLLCSDGLSGVVEEDTLANVLLEATNLREACERLIGKANESGGPDNITALLAEPLAR